MLSELSSIVKDIREATEESQHPIGVDVFAEIDNASTLFPGRPATPADAAEGLLAMAEAANRAAWYAKSLAKKELADALRIKAESYVEAAYLLSILPKNVFGEVSKSIVEEETPIDTDQGEGYNGTYEPQTSPFGDYESDR